jgi:hypothetical protein
VKNDYPSDLNLAYADSLSSWSVVCRVKEVRCMTLRITLTNGDFIEESFDDAVVMSVEMQHWAWLFNIMGERDAFQHLRETAAKSRLASKVQANPM